MQRAVLDDGARVEAADTDTATGQPDIDPEISTAYLA
jgi:hypothetical protein